MPSNEVIKALAVCAELCGANLSDGAAKVIAAEIGGLDERDVIAGLTAMRREHDGRFSLAAILRFVQQARTERLTRQVKCHVCGQPASQGDLCAIHVGYQERARQAKPLSYHMDRLKVARKSA